MKIAYNGDAIESVHSTLARMVCYNIELTAGQMKIAGQLTSVFINDNGFLTLRIRPALDKWFDRLADNTLELPIADPAHFEWCDVQVLVL